jgi:hypothetical protein
MLIYPRLEKLLKLRRRTHEQFWRWLHSYLFLRLPHQTKTSYARFLGSVTFLQQ